MGFNLLDKGKGGMVGTGIVELIYDNKMKSIYQNFLFAFLK